MIHNPNADPYANALIGLAVSMAAGDGGDTFIREQERNGQAQLVNSEVLPTDMGDRAAYEAVGFTFGDPIQDDNLFTHATLPEGWRKERSDHAMWSYIIDPLGRRRVSVFYKAAFYDRKAHMSLTSVDSYAIDCAALWGDGDQVVPVLDDEWATKEAVCAALREYADREAADADRFEASLPGRTPDNVAGCRRLIDNQRTRVAKARSFADRIATS